MEHTSRAVDKAIRCLTALAQLDEDLMRKTADDLTGKIAVLPDETVVDDYAAIASAATTALATIDREALAEAIRKLSATNPLLVVDAIQIVCRCSVAIGNALAAMSDQSGDQNSRETPEAPGLATRFDCKFPKTKDTQAK